MLILVSNDDGITAPGLEALVRVMKELGDVVVVAPDRERSGVSHSLTLHRPLRIEARGENCYAVDGTPTDCVNLAVNAILDRRPGLVVSGINLGPNLGEDITYSGTFSAALEGVILGIPSVAVSLACMNGEPPNFLPAAHVARTIVGDVIEKGLPTDVVLNVNVPNVSGERVDDVEFTRMGKRRYGGAIAEKLDPRGRKYYWIGADEMGFDDVPGTDCHAVAQGRVSVTPVRMDLTHDGFLGVLKRQWRHAG